MSSKFGEKLKNKSISILKFLFLAIICIVISTAIVWPLWKFATSASKAYSITIISLIIIFLIYLIVKKIRKSIINKKNDQKA